MLFLPSIILVFILIKLTFTSVKSGILPHKWTLGGSLAAISLSVFLPKLVQHQQQIVELKQSLIGWCVGLFSTWTIIEISKALLGRKVLNFPDGMSFSILPNENSTPVLKVGDLTLAWDELYTRTTDLVILEGASILISSTVPIERKESEVKRICIGHHTLWFDQISVPLGNILIISGTILKLTLPREIMGFGIALMTAMVGAFFGWQAALIIFSGSLLLLFAVAALYAMSARTSEVHGQLQVAPCMLVCALVYIVYIHVVSYGVF